MDLQHETPCFYDVPQSVQLAKALAADERDKDKENLVDARQSLGAKRKIPMNYFVRGRMTEEHAHEVYYSNRTMTAAEKNILLPEAVRTLYEERRRLMDWALMRLERRIKVYARGEKIYKIGGNGALVERFKDIILTWKEDGSDTLYNKLFHAFIGQFDMCPQYFYELSREYMDLPNVWWEFDENICVRGQNKRDSSIKTIITAHRAKLIDRVNNAGKNHNKMLTVTRRAAIRERDGKWSRRVKGIPLPPLLKKNVSAVEESIQKVRKKIKLQ
jgi:hypothetical protein